MDKNVCLLIPSFGSNGYRRSILALVVLPIGSGQFSGVARYEPRCVNKARQQVRPLTDAVKENAATVKLYCLSSAKTKKNKLGTKVKASEGFSSV